MSSLTEKKKREIENLYLKMKQKSCKKIMLYVKCNIQTVDLGPVVVEHILKAINKMSDIEAASYTYGTNIVTVTANWKDYEVNQKIKYIKQIPNVLDVEAYILNPLF
jgi:nitrate reductase NapAB chaperone NapD